MYEGAQEIFDYLPIEAGSESVYIQHLFGAFRLLDEAEEPTRAFSILPFHLLFMLAIQYMVFRISLLKKDEYLEVLKICRLYDKGQEIVLKNNPPIADENGNIPSSCSARNISLLREKQIFDFLCIINISEDIIKRAKNLVEIRGTYAHANGNIEEDIEARIDEYLVILREIQKCMSVVNKGVQNWMDEVGEGEFPLDDFFRERFLQSQFSSRDFGDIIGVLLEAEKLDFEQWEQIVNKGLELAYDQTILALREIAENDLDEGKKFNAKRVLNENGEFV